jgi:uncharacterized protein YecE (DUF72 family)
MGYSLPFLTYQLFLMEIRSAGSCYSGTSGLVLPVKNKQAFPPDFQDKSRLTYYASLFNSIEINSSFYKVPMASTVARWASEVPGGFRFTFKLWREITHNKGLAFRHEDVTRFMDVISAVGPKRGCLLIQFPPSVKATNIRQFEALMSSILHNESQWRLAVEFRDRSWYREGVYDLLRSFGAALVLQDMPASVTPHLEPLENFAYIRFHGPGGSYRGSYSEEVINEYAGYIKDWMSQGTDVFVYFNNTVGDAVGNLKELNRYLTE